MPGLVSCYGGFYMPGLVSCYGGFYQFVKVEKISGLRRFKSLRINTVYGNISVLNHTIIQYCRSCTNYKDADKSLARPGRKQATATEDFVFHISYL
jgi:hypothetical protein